MRPITINSNEYRKLNMAKSKPIIKSSSIEKSIETSLSKLDSTYDDCSTAVTALSKEAKKYAKEAKQLTKKRATLSKRKKTMTKKYKKDSSAQNKKALAAVVKELTAVTKQNPKIKALKSANSEELAALKTQLKAISAYLKGIKQADKILSKTKKPTRAKRGKKPSKTVTATASKNVSATTHSAPIIHKPVGVPNVQSEASL